MLYIFTGNDSEYVFDTGVMPNGYGMKCRYDSSDESFNTTIYYSKDEWYFCIQSSGRFENIQDSIKNVKELGMPKLEERIKTIQNDTEAKSV